MMAPPLPSFDVTLTPAEVIRRVHDNARVRKSNRRYPNPPPPWGRPLLLMERPDDPPWLLRLRHYSGPQDPISPVLTLCVFARPYGSHVTAKYVGYRDYKRTKMALVAIPSLILAAALPLPGIPIAALLTLATARSLWAPSTDPHGGLMRYDPQFRALLGEVLVPFRVTRPAATPYRSLCA